MILLPPDLRAELRANDVDRRTAQRNGSAEPDPLPRLKLFNPPGPATWLATELADDGDMLFGLADLGFGCPELGSFSLSEIAAVHLPFGQKRALLIWQRIVMPDGSSLRIDNVSATDPSGYAGLQDKVDFHTWQLLKGVAISTLLGIGADLQFSGNGGLIEAIRQSGTQNVSRAGDQLTSKALDIQPTITIRPGAPLRLVVHKDLVFAPYGKEG